MYKIPKANSIPFKVNSVFAFISRPNAKTTKEIPQIISISGYLKLILDLQYLHFPFRKK